MYDSEERLRAAASRIREWNPRTAESLWRWVHEFTGIRLVRKPVCAEHQSPFTAFCHLYFDEPAESIWLGPRGGGKSFMAALHSHLRSRFNPRHGTRILGGSKAQSRQIHGGLTEAILDGRGPSGFSDRESIAKLLVESATYANGSEIAILAASKLSVRGPHVPDLKLDEVDEIPTSLREDAYGMAMRKQGVSSTILLTSTWHNVGGPMTALMERADTGELPRHTFCLFEVLENCPSTRSGPYVGGESIYENCPSCELKSYCHTGDLGPKAKRADGHYSIDSAIQKVRGVSPAAFKSDYLCQGPRAEGLWFTDFSNENISETRAEHVPGLPVYLGLDTGVYTGATFFQLVPLYPPSRRPQSRNRIYSPPEPKPEYAVRVLADYLSYDRRPDDVANDLEAVRESASLPKPARIFADPAGNARNGTGQIILVELAKAGLVGSSRGEIERWPVVSIRDSLALLEAFLLNAAGERRLHVHPRCKRAIEAFRGYRRAKRQGQWQDQPEDPQHPHEDLIDSLRGALRALLPDGRIGGNELPRIRPEHLF